jgi:hypothetical protein
MVTFLRALGVGSGEWYELYRIWEGEDEGEGEVKGRKERESRRDRS